jgi:hypothetical protein
VFHVFAALAAARARGRRPSVLRGHNLQVAREMYAGSAGFWLNGIDNGC